MISPRKLIELVEILREDATKFWQKPYEIEGLGKNTAAEFSLNNFTSEIHKHNNWF